MCQTGYISLTGDLDDDRQRGTVTIGTASSSLGLASMLSLPRETCDKLLICNWADKDATVREE